MGSEKVKRPEFHARVLELWRNGRRQRNAGRNDPPALAAAERDIDEAFEAAIASLRVGAAIGNPNHPVSLSLEGQWHKIAAILLYALGEENGAAEFEIDGFVLGEFARQFPGGAVVADARGGRFVLRLVDAETADRLAREEGGLPV